MEEVKSCKGQVVRVLVSHAHNRFLALVQLATAALQVCTRLLYQSTQLTQIVSFSIFKNHFL